MKKVISTTNAPAAIGPYSQAIEVNGMVFASGQIPVNPATGEIPEGIEAQAEQVMKNMKNLLEAAGTSIDQVVKTSVFIKLIEKVIDDGKGIIVMVPEISLTPQFVSQFSKRFGDKIAVFHSALSLGERLDEYKRVKQGLAQIVIGTRSAVFAPFDKVRLDYYGRRAGIQLQVRKLSTLSCKRDC